MTMQKPEFHLQRVYDDGPSGPPEILPLLELPVGTQMGRRGFLGTGLAAGSFVALLSASAANDAAASERSPPAKLILAHTDIVKSLAITSDGGMLVSGSADKTIKLWSLPDGKLQKTLKGHENAVRALAITPDGRILVSVSSDHSIRLNSLPGGIIQKIIRDTDEKALAITPDGKTLVSVSSSKLISCRSLPDGADQPPMMEANNETYCLTITPDGKTLVAGSSAAAGPLGGTVTFWSLPGGALEKSFAGHGNIVRSLAVTLDSKILASGSADTRIKLWSLPYGGFLRTLEGHQGTVNALAITPDGKTLISGSSDKTIKLWSLSEAREAMGVGGKARPPLATEFRTWKSQNGKYTTEAQLLEATDRLVRIKKKTGEALTIRLEQLCEEDRAYAERLRIKGAAARALRFHKSLDHHEFDVASLAVTPDGRWLASGDTRGVIILWDLTDTAAADNAKLSKPARYLFDRKAVQDNAVSYNVLDNVTGQIITYTLPCGSPIPPGATCTCNCVPGTYAPPPPPSRGGGGGTYCQCVPVCTCVPICQAHRLLDPSPVVRRMAEQLLLVMGVAERAYMTWAADGAGAQLRNRIRAMMDAVDAGAQPDWRQWPSAAEYIPMLDHTDEVIAIMAAQMLTLQQQVQAVPVPVHLTRRVAWLLDAAAQRPWHLREPDMLLRDRERQFNSHELGDSATVKEKEILT